MFRHEFVPPEGVLSKTLHPNFSASLHTNGINCLNFRKGIPILLIVAHFWHLAFRFDRDSLRKPVSDRNR